MTATAEILRGAKAVLLANGWHQGGFYDREQHLDKGVPREACRVCLWGAVNVAAMGNPASKDDVPWAVILFLDKVLGERTEGWSDTPGRTVDEVLALLDRAIDIAEAGESR